MASAGDDANGNPRPPRVPQQAGNVRRVIRIPLVRGGIPGQRFTIRIGTPQQPGQQQQQGRGERERGRERGKKGGRRE